MDKQTERLMRIIKVLIIMLIICVLFFYGTFLFPYAEFYFSSKPEFQVVTPFTDIVPQGIEYLEDEDIFLVSGYVYPKGYSQLIVVDPQNRKYTKSIVNSKGKQFKWHSGGIACHGDYVYVTGGNSKCYVLSKQDLLDKDKHEVTIIGTIKTESNSSFCFVYGTCLYIGEYQYKTKFATDKDHHIFSMNGNYNTAMVFAYPFSSDSKYGVSKDPIMALSIGSAVQGMCMDKLGHMYLSASSSRFNESILYVYDFRKVIQTVDYSYKHKGKTIPVYVFEDRAMLKKTLVPPNAEGITASDESVYLMFESASTRFKYGWLFGTQYVYDVNIERFLELDEYY